MKRIVVDYKIPWLYPRAGIAGFFNPLLQGLADRFPDVEFLVVSPGEGDGAFPQNANCRRLHLGYPRAFSRMDHLRYSLISFPSFLKGREADLLLSPYYDFIVPRGFSGRTILTVHDLCFLDVPFVYPFWTRLLQRFWLNAAVRRADAIATVSEFSRSRLLAHFGAILQGKEPCVVYNSFAPPCMTEQHAEELRRRLSLPQSAKVMLYTGGFDARKNVRRLFRGFRQLLNDVDAVLVVTGTSATNAGLRRLANECGIEERVVLTGPLEDGDMALLYAAVADCCVNLSLYEGAGRSAIEAQLHGLPAVSSPLPAVREMVGDYPLYCDPMNVEEVADALARALQLPRREPEADARFSLSRNVERLGDLVEAML